MINEIVLSKAQLDGGPREGEEAPSMEVKGDHDSRFEDIEDSILRAYQLLEPDAGLEGRSLLPSASCTVVDFSIDRSGMNSVSLLN